MQRNFHHPGRSPVVAMKEMAATSHPLATATALELLRQGGSAVDAAIGACAVQCVVEPHMTGIGGDCFILICEPNGNVVGINGSGRTSAKLEIDDLPEDENHRLAADSIHAVTVPGSVKAWETIHKSHGKLTFATVLKPAVEFASYGFPVAPRVAYDWQKLSDKLMRNETSKKLYLPNGKVPQVGEIIKLPQLANTLSEIGLRGSEAFYTGEIAKDITTTVQKYNGFLDEDDLAANEIDVVKPIVGSYRGTSVVELPPNSQGIIALIILAILERFKLTELDPIGPERAHLHLEASRIAYAVRDLLLSDPEYLPMDHIELLNSKYIDQLVAKIDLTKRTNQLSRSILMPKSDTVYLAVVDREGCAVSFINSLYQGFGVGICTEKTGIMLQNRGACFTLQRDHPNCIAPSKRPLHTIIPAMAFSGQDPWLCFGVMGGAYQPCGHAHVLSNIIDYDFDVQAAIDFPRWFFDESSHQIEVEQGVPLSTIEGLESKGHQVNICEDPIGGGQAIMFDRENNCLIGASDPRKDGCALGR